MTTLETIRSADGLEGYLDALEERLARTVASHPGVVAAVGNEALAAGGKRLRPLLVFLSTPPGEEPSLAAGVAVELVHMATLVHDDLIDRAHFRRGKAAAWSVHGAGAARATGDYLFARAFAELTATGDAEAVKVLADMAVDLREVFRHTSSTLQCGRAGRIRTAGLLLPKQALCRAKPPPAFPGSVASPAR